VVETYAELDIDKRDAHVWQFDGKDVSGGYSLKPPEDNAPDTSRTAYQTPPKGQ
jgi:hypothetical protein